MPPLEDPVTVYGLTPPFASIVIVPSFELKQLKFVAVIVPCIAVAGVLRVILPVVLHPFASVIVAW